MTEPTPAGLAEAAALLADAWSQRSTGERSAFADRLASVSAPRDLPENLLRTIQERAALSGAVAPRHLVRGLAREIAARSLDLLAPDFDRMQAGGQWSWMLRAEPRGDTLSRLRAAGRVPAVLADVASIPTDPAGQALRMLAATGSVPAAAPATVVQALAWAQPLGGLAGDLAEAERQAALASLWAGYDALVRHGVFGRDSELARLRAFAEEASDAAQPVPLLPVTGIGGAGKSTVLGHLILPYLDRIAAGVLTGPAVVVIDFDRVLFRPDAELELSFELSRQLGYAAPVAAADFSALRYQVRSEQRESGSDTFQGSSRSASASREVSGFEREMGRLIELHQMQDRPVLLVLDTFEEWQREQPHPNEQQAGWNLPESRIADWISTVRNEMRLAGLRVVISGRAELADAETRPAVHIGDLEPAAAQALLAAIGVNSADAPKLVRLTGRNPLTLHVAARFYRGLRRRARREFLAGDPVSASGLNEELQRAVLYGRFLDHIADDRVRKLAHPGLVLRRVTPDLVRSVLALHCGLGAIDQATAEELTARLAAEVWLVRQAPDGLHHRSEVRRAMLKLMVDDPQYVAVARQIHADAVRWYRDGRDPVLSGDAAGVEALYHELMLETGDEPVHGYDWAAEDADYRWERLARELGEAVTELPAAVAAQVRVLRGEEIANVDASLLPGRVWHRWITRRGATLVAADQATGALALFEARPTAWAEPPWLAQAYCDAARWGDYWPTARRLLRPEPEAGSSRHAVLDAVLSPHAEDVAEAGRALAAYLAEPSQSLAAVGLPGSFSERLFFHLLLSSGVPRSPLFVPPPARALPPPWTTELLRTQQAQRLHVSDPYPVDQLRRMMVWLADPAADGPFILEKAAALYRPDPRWITDFAKFIGIGSDALQDHLVGLRRAAQADARSDVMLGDWSTRFARTLGGPEVTVYRYQVSREADLMYVLRGDNPELRPAILLALAELATGETALANLGEIAGRLLPVPAADLRFADLPAAGRRDVRRALIQLVEYVDRSGVMFEFLTQARLGRPATALIHRVSAAFGVWDHAHRQMLDRLAAEPPGEAGMGSWAL
jgi:AAA ATPase domain